MGISTVFDIMTKEDLIKLSENINKIKEIENKKKQGDKNENL